MKMKVSECRDKIKVGQKVRIYGTEGFIEDFNNYNLFIKTKHKYISVNFIADSETEIEILSSNLWDNLVVGKTQFEHKRKRGKVLFLSHKDLIYNISRFDSFKEASSDNYTLEDLKQDFTIVPPEPEITEEEIQKAIELLTKRIFEDNKKKGFWDKPRETGTLLMLIVSELGEALEADRISNYADQAVFNLYNKNISNNEFNKQVSFGKYIKDTFEDEIADAIIRLLDLCGAKGIDIEKHIKLKMEYNRARELKHGKKY